MTFADYWERLKTANPGLQNGTKLTLTVEALEKLLAKSFEEGRYQAKIDDQFQSLFGRIFG